MTTPTHDLAIARAERDAWQSTCEELHRTIAGRDVEIEAHLGRCEAADQRARSLEAGLAHVNGNITECRAELRAIRDLVAPGNPQGTVVDAVRAMATGLIESIGARDAAEQARDMARDSRDAAIARAEAAERTLSGLYDDSKAELAKLRAELAELRARPVLTEDLLRGALDAHGYAGLTRKLFAHLGPFTLPSPDRAEELTAAIYGDSFSELRAADRSSMVERTQDALAKLSPAPAPTFDAAFLRRVMVATKHGPNGKGGPGPCMTCGAWPPGTRELIAACQTRIAGLEQAAGERAKEVARLTAELAAERQERAAGVTAAITDVREIERLNREIDELRSERAAYFGAAVGVAQALGLSSLGPAGEDPRFYAEALAFARSLEGHAKKLTARMAELETRPVLTEERLRGALFACADGASDAEVRAILAALGPVMLPAQDRAEELCRRYHDSTSTISIARGPAWSEYSDEGRAGRVSAMHKELTALAKLSPAPAREVAPTLVAVSDEDLGRAVWSKYNNADPAAWPNITIGVRAMWTAAARAVRAKLGAAEVTEERVKAALCEHFKYEGHRDWSADARAILAYLRATAAKGG